MLRAGKMVSTWSVSLLVMDIPEFDRLVFQIDRLVLKIDRLVFQIDRFVP